MEIRPVAREGDIGQRGPAAGRGAQATTSINAATRKGQIAQGGSGIACQVNAAAFAQIAGAVGVGPAGGDDKPVQYCCAVHAATAHHVVAVVAHDVAPRFGDEVAVVVRVVLVDVAAEDGQIALPVALVQAGFGAGKAAVEHHAVFEHECGATVGAAGGIVDAGGHPDLVAALRRGQGRLQAGVGIGPARAVVGAGGVVVDVERVLRPHRRRQPHQQKSDNKSFHNFP